MNKGVLVEAIDTSLETVEENVVEKIYAIGVAFYTKKGLGKPYTYKSKEAIEKDTIVECSFGRMDRQGTVVSCESDFKYNPNIEYKFVTKIVKKKEQVKDE
jgi:hypothetical protein